MIEIDVSHSLGAQEFEVRLSVEDRGITALFGRSGAGKTTIVNMIAGLVKPDWGSIAVNGRTLYDSKAGINLPPEKRRIGYVFQEGRLFPHMSVHANLVYGMKRTPAADRCISEDAVIRTLGIEPLLPRRAHNLSGGEKQRVALGRALLTSPDLLLMDEPLASLDGPRKAEILPFIEALRDEFGIPIVYVTHSVEEIVRLADVLALVADGRIAAVGGVEELTSRLDLRPLTGRHEAGAVIAARVDGGEPEFGLAHLHFEGGTMMAPATGLEQGQDVRIRVRARDVALATVRPADISMLNVFEGIVTEIAPTAEGGEAALVDVSIDVGVPLLARVTRRSVHDLGIEPGRTVYALIKTVAIDRHSMGVRSGTHPEGE